MKDRDTSAKMKDRSVRRNYVRTCGICGERYDQSEMLKDRKSPTGWICLDCNDAIEPEIYGEF